MEQDPGLTSKWKRRLFAAPHGVKLLLGALAAILALLAVIDGVLPAGGGVLTRALVGGFSILIMAVYVILSVVIPDDRPWHTPSRRLKADDDNDAWSVEGPELFVLREIVDAPRPGDPRRVKGYAHLLLGLAARMYHCSETYELHDGSRRRTIEADYRLSENMLKKLMRLGNDGDEARTSICFPIMAMRKGALPHDLAISVDGRRPPITPYEEVQRLQVLTLRSLFVGTFGASVPPGLFDRALAAIGWEGSPSAREGSRGEKARLHRARVMKLLDDLDAALIKMKPQTGLQDSVHLRKFISVYSNAYPVCFELPRESLREMISVRILMGVPSIDVVDGFRDRLRAWLEIENFKFRMPLTRMFMSKSYHLSFLGHASQFLYSQHLEECEDSGQGASTTRRVWLSELRHGNATGQSHVRLESWNQRPRSHFYARGFRSMDLRPLFSVVRLHERPPGPLGTAASMLALNALLIAVFGFFATSRNFPSSLNLSAFLLALPAISLHFTGSIQRDDPAAHLSLKSWLGRAVAMWTSLLAVVLYALEQTGIFLPTVRNVGVVGLSLPYDDAWLALLVAAGGSAIYLIVSVVFRTFLYRARLTRVSEVDDAEIVAARMDFEKDIEALTGEVSRDERRTALTADAPTPRAESER